MALVAIIIGLAACGVALGAPEQIHLSLTGQPDEMMAMWTTTKNTATSTVIYWAAGNNQNFTATGSFKHYDFVPHYVSPALHRAKMTKLALDTQYFYVVGDATDGFSDVYNFTSEPSTPPSPLRIAHIADHGTTIESVDNVNRLVEQHKLAPYSFLMLSGDISYANGNEPIWDQWGNIAQPAASLIPWMVSVGNHEILDAYLAYLYRFAMPTNGPAGNMYYSFDYSNVHVIALSSEDPEYWHADPQYLWLHNDLKKIDRTKTPWVLAMWHNPWYCSNDNHYGAGDVMRESYEDLFYEFKVDLVLNGHVHAYQRALPVYKGNLTADAPVYITAGIGGNKEGLYNHWKTPDPVWNAYHEAMWGYGTISIYNASHLHWNARRYNDSFVMDEVWIVKDR